MRGKWLIPLLRPSLKTDQKMLKNFSLIGGSRSPRAVISVQNDEIFQKNAVSSHTMLVGFVIKF